MVSADVIALRPGGAADPGAQAPSGDAERRYSWLLSGYDEPVWTVSDSAMFRIGSPDEPRTRVIDFRYVMPDGTCLTDTQNADQLRLAKRYAVLLREHESLQIDTAVLHVAQVRCLFNIYAWCALQDDPIDRMEDLRRQDVARFVHAAKFGVGAMMSVRGRAASLHAQGVDLSDEASVRRKLHLPQGLAIADDLAVAAGTSNGTERKPIVHNPLFRQLLPFEHLWRFRREIEGDNIRFDPFETSASAEAAKHCSDTGRTPVIPHLQAMTLIDGCIRLLVDSGPVLLALRGKLGDDPEVPFERRGDADGIAAVLEAEGAAVAKLRAQFRIRAEVRPIDAVETATVLMVQACFVIIAALTARRHEEVGTLRTGCIIGGDGSSFVFSAILKTERANQHTPVPDIVSRVVDWLTRLGAPARSLSGSSRLFTWTDARTLGRRVAVRQLGAMNLDRLASVCGVPPCEGTSWHFTVRQFRRFFAILYMWRHEHPDLGALRYHLRHWDFAQTRAYCTDQSLGRIFTQEQRTFTRTVVTEAMTGARAVGGAVGGRLTAMTTRLKTKYSGVVAMVPDRVATWAERISDRMVIRCNPWSYCACPNTRRGARDAHCRTGDGDPDGFGPNLANATPETCIGCRHRMTDPVFAPFMRAEVAQGERILAQSNLSGTVFARATARRLEVLRPHLAAADAAGGPA